MAENGRLNKQKNLPGTCKCKPGQDAYGKDMKKQTRRQASCTRHTTTFRGFEIDRCFCFYPFFFDMFSFTYLFTVVSFFLCHQFVYAHKDIVFLLQFVHQITQKVVKFIRPFRIGADMKK